MTVIIEIALFLAGMCLSVQVIAALYGIIDLWYTIKTAYPKVIRGILVWCAVTIAVAWFLGDLYRPAFLWGLAVYVLVYLGSFIGQQLLVKRNARLIESE